MLFAAFMGQTGSATATTAHRALAPIDIAIIAVYFVIVFGIGFYFSRKERTSEDYFLAGRDIGWFFIGASLFVSNISTEHFIGLSGTGASSGLAVGHFEWLACMILLSLVGYSFPFICGRTFSPCRNFWSGASAAVRDVSGRHFHRRLYLHQNFRTAVCGKRGAGARSRLGSGKRRWCW